MHQPAFIDTSREHLLALRKTLLSMAETRDEATAVVELDQAKVGRLSRMDALQAQAMAKAGIERRDRELRRITAALQRIERGEYGICEDCDRAIAEKRLEADPAATLCIRCASARES